MDLFTDRLRYKQTNYSEKDLRVYFVNTCIFRTKNPYTALMFFIDSKHIDPSVLLFRFEEKIAEKLVLLIQVEKKAIDKKNFHNLKRKLPKIPYEDEDKLRQKLITKELDSILSILFSWINTIA